MPFNTPPSEDLEQPPSGYLTNIGNRLSCTKNGSAATLTLQQPGRTVSWQTNKGGDSEVNDYSERGRENPP